MGRGKKICVRITPHRSGKDTTLKKLLRKAAHELYSSKDESLLVAKSYVPLDKSTASRTLPRKLEQLQETWLVKMWYISTCAVVSYYIAWRAC